MRARGAAWLAHWTVNPEVAGSSPVEPAIKISHFRDAQTVATPRLVPVSHLVRPVRAGRASPRPPPDRLADDRVPPVDALGLVPGHRHGGRPRDTGPLQVPDGRPPEVVRDAPRAPGRLAGLPPGLVQLLDRLALAVEHPRDDARPARAGGLRWPPAGPPGQRAAPASWRRSGPSLFFVVPGSSRIVPAGSPPGATAAGAARRASASR